MANDALRALLDEAHDILGRGDAAEAERRAKAVSALIRAERDLAEFQLSQSEDQKDDADARAELFGWISRVVAAHSAGASEEELERLAGENPAGRVELSSEPGAIAAGG